MRDVKNIVNIGTGDIIGNLCSAGFWFYLAILITPESFGELNYFISIAAITSYCVLIGTQNTITVYVAKKIPIQSTFNFISLVGAVAAFIILLLIFNRIDLGFLVFGYVLSNLAIGRILGKREYKDYMKYVLIQKILTPVLGLGFFFIFGIEYVIIGLALSYIVYSFRIATDFKKIKINFSLLYSRKGFIINNYVVALSNTAHGQIDKLIIMPILGAGLLGNYSLSLQIITMMMILSSVIYKYLVPQEASGQNIRDVKRVLLLIGIGLTLIGFFIVPIILPLVFTEYTESIDAIRIMSLSFLPMTIARIYESKFLALEKSRFLLIGTLISISVLIPTMILFGIWFEVLGIAISFVISTIIQVIYFLIVNRKWNFQQI